MRSDDHGFPAYLQLIDSICAREEMGSVSYFGQAHGEVIQILVRHYLAPKDLPKRERSLELHRGFGPVIVADNGRWKIGGRVVAADDGCEDCYPPLPKWLEGVRWLWEGHLMGDLWLVERPSWRLLEGQLREGDLPLVIVATETVPPDPPFPEFTWSEPLPGVLLAELRAELHPYVGAGHYSGDPEHPRPKRVDICDHPSDPPAVANPAGTHEEDAP